jgi:hypothetical protein
MTAPRRNQFAPNIVRLQQKEVRNEEYSTALRRDHGFRSHVGVIAADRTRRAGDQPG